MSASKNRHEAGRWLETAREDLTAAKLMAAHKMYSHACFLAQQGGEKAVKALWFMSGQDPWGHSIQKLVSDFPQRKILRNPRRWIEKAALLDRYYIPTRYPNGLPDLTPGASYFQRDATRAIQTAQFIVSEVESIVRNAVHQSAGADETK
jgi:HEPN domain-containing protein